MSALPQANDPAPDAMTLRLQINHTVCIGTLFHRNSCQAPWSSNLLKIRGMRVAESLFHSAILVKEEENFFCEPCPFDRAFLWDADGLTHQVFPEGTDLNIFE